MTEWRFLLREFGELVKRVILLNAATAIELPDAGIGIEVGTFILLLFCNLQ